MDTKRGTEGSEGLVEVFWICINPGLNLKVVKVMKNSYLAILPGFLKKTPHSGCAGNVPTSRYRPDQERAGDGLAGWRADLFQRGHLQRAPLHPDQVRIPCYIVIFATFVTIVEMVLQAFVPPSMRPGVFVPSSCQLHYSRPGRLSPENPVLPRFATDWHGLGLPGAAGCFP